MPEQIQRRSGESVVFLTSAALLVLHVLDDGFFQPEPGTSAGDNVLYVSVFVGVLVAAALVYPRVRPGARAAIAGITGVACLAYAVVAVAEAFGQGLAGHDYTALLLLPAGIALLALAGATLWRYRRTGGSRTRRYLRRAGIAAVAVLLAALVAQPLALAIGLTHRPRAEVKPADLGRPYEEVTLTTEDGLDLAAWYVPSENGAAVIVFPGRGSRAPQARMLAEAGYGVLMLDMRGQGESEGVPNAFGWGSDRDLDTAIAYLQERPDVEEGRIGGIGYSVGGELLIEAAAENDGLAAVVSEGAGERSWRETMLQGSGAWSQLPTVVALNGIITVITGDPPPPSLEDLVGRISPRPLFLIYATNGQGGENLNPQYYEAAGEPKEIWEITTGGHTGGFEAEPEEYERRVLAFFENALGA
ncbi:MAG TPA: alpha/beta fold hydrolase [Gaiellaceae bacterium]|nr:alpha/beta fold hydrolase [Gaiellaceae bacterium]